MWNQEASPESSSATDLPCDIEVFIPPHSLSRFFPLAGLEDLQVPFLSHMH